MTYDGINRTEDLLIAIIDEKASRGRKEAEAELVKRFVEARIKASIAKAGVRRIVRPAWQIN